MSHLQYGVYPGMGEWARDKLGYNQAVRVGDRIEISGQGAQRHSQPRKAMLTSWNSQAAGINSRQTP